MVRVLGKEIFKLFNVPPKIFVRVLLKLHDVLPKEGSFMDRVKDLNEIIPRRDRIYCQTIKPLLG